MLRREMSITCERLGEFILATLHLCCYYNVAKDWPLKKPGSHDNVFPMEYRAVFSYARYFGFFLPSFCFLSTAVFPLRFRSVSTSIHGWTINRLVLCRNAFFPCRFLRWNAPLPMQLFEQSCTEQNHLDGLKINMIWVCPFLSCALYFQCSAKIVYLAELKIQVLLRFWSISN